MDSGYGVDSNFVRACLVALGLLCGLLQGCGGGPSDPPPVVLRSISVSPSAPQLALGVTQQFTANGTFSDGTTRDVSSQATWSSSSSAVATVTSSGLAKAVGVGSAQIQASSNSVSGSTTLQVTSAALQSISVSPSAPQLALGLTQQFTANGTFSDGTTGDVSSQVTWTSSSPTVASIVSGGLAKAVGVGSTQIQAGSNSVSGSTTLQVTAAVLSQINVTPAQASLVMNSWEAAPTQQFRATGVFSDGTQQDLTSTAAWSASPSTVASVSAGLATTLTVGSTSIMASSGSISGSGSLTVTTGLEKLSHIIFLVQENRSFDNYFGVLGQYRASKIAGALPTDVDGAGNLNPQPALPNANSPAQFISPYHFRTVCHDNASAGWFPSHDDVNSGMQDFLINVAKNTPATNDPYGDRPIGFYNEQDLPYYY